MNLLKWVDSEIFWNRLIYVTCTIMYSAIIVLQSVNTIVLIEKQST